MPRETDDTLYDWAQHTAAALELPAQSRWAAERDTVTWVLDLARDIAHGVARPAAPVGAFLAGVAVGLSGASDRRALEDARRALDQTLPGDRA